MCWFMQLLVAVTRALLCYFSRDEVQKDLCRLLSKPVGRAVSPLEGAKDINLFTCEVQIMRFSYTVYNTRWNKTTQCVSLHLVSSIPFEKNGIRAEKSALGPNWHRMFNQMMWCVYLNWVGWRYISTLH